MVFRPAVPAAPGCYRILSAPDESFLQGMRLSTTLRFQVEPSSFLPSLQLIHVESFLLEFIGLSSSPLACLAAELLKTMGNKRCLCYLPLAQPVLEGIGQESCALKKIGKLQTKGSLNIHIVPK